MYNWKRNNLPQNSFIFSSFHQSHLTYFPPVEHKIRCFKITVSTHVYTIKTLWPGLSSQNILGKKSIYRMQFFVLLLCEKEHVYKMQCILICVSWKKVEVRFSFKHYESLFPPKVIVTFYLTYLIFSRFYISLFFSQNCMTKMTNSFFFSQNY